jgi:hypothetical protein
LLRENAVCGAALQKKEKGHWAKWSPAQHVDKKLQKKNPSKNILYTDMMQKMSAGSRRRHLKGEKWLRQNASEPPPYNGRS